MEERLIRDAGIAEAEPGEARKGLPRGDVVDVGAGEIEAFEGEGGEGANSLPGNVCLGEVEAAKGGETGERGEFDDGGAQEAEVRQERPGGQGEGFDVGVVEG